MSCLIVVGAWAASMPVGAADPPPFEFMLEADAGEWLVLDIPIAEPVAEFAWWQDVEIVASAPPGREGNILIFPLALWTDWGASEWESYHTPEHVVVAPGSQYTFSEARSRGASAAGFSLESLAIGVAADVPFTLSLVIDPDPGYPGFEPALVNSGVGTAAHVAERTFEAAEGRLGQLELEGTFASPGWRHVQVDFDWIAIDFDGIEETVRWDARRYQFDFPNVSWSGVGVNEVVAYREFQWDYGSFFGTSSGYLPEGMGYFVDGPGDYEVVVSYAQPGHVASVVVFEMPGTFTMPGHWDAIYEMDLPP